MLKALKSKKLIKEVKSVNSTRKIVYMLYDLEPDSSITGGAWYSEQEFESEFVEILNQQCYRFLHQRLETAKRDVAVEGPLAVRNASHASADDVLDYISNLGISKVTLKTSDIEAILNTLIFDGKVEKDVSASTYRAVEALLPTPGLMRVPCGGCPNIKSCSVDGGGKVTPTKCVYMKDWLASQ